MKLGEIFHESRGRVVLTRVLDTEGRGNIEFSSNGKGMIKGIETNETITLTAPIPLRGKSPIMGKGMLMTVSGEIALFKLSGVGYPKESGGAIDIGSVVYSATSTEKLAWLDYLLGLFELEDDIEGNYTLKVWALDR